MINIQKKLFYLTIPALILLFSAPLLANPWVQDKDRVQVALTVGYSFFDTYLDPAGDEVAVNDDYKQYEAYYFYNWGLGNRQDLSVMVGFVSAHAETEAPGLSKTKNQGIANSRIRYRKQLHNRHTAIALIGGLVIPGTYEEDFLNSPGDGSVDIEAGVSIGEYYDERVLYWSADVLYRVRLGIPADEMEIDAEVGRVFDKWLIRGIATYVAQTSGSGLYDTAYGSGSVSFEEMNEDRLKIGAGFDYRTATDRSIGLTYMATQNGSNTRDDFSIFLTYTAQNR